ncbi:MAG: endolytic transglycosylase MltG [Streptosporangiaceae bacterium]|nr:endolytic transglycosylase MltG [Streptosporangiaceae bacterium]
MSARHAGRGDGEYDRDATGSSGTGSGGIWRGDPARPGGRPPGPPGDSGPGGIWRGDSGRGATGPGGIWPGQDVPLREPREPREPQGARESWGHDRRNPAARQRTAGYGRPQEPSRSRESRDPREPAWPRDAAQRQPWPRDPAAVQPPRPAGRQGNWPPAAPRDRDPRPRRDDRTPRDPYAPPGRDPRRHARYEPADGAQYPPDPGYPPGGYPPDRYPPEGGYRSPAGYPPGERYPAGAGYPAGAAYAPGDGPYPGQGEEDAGWDDGDADDRFLPGFGDPGDESDDRGGGDGRRGRRRGRARRRGRGGPGDDFGGPGGSGRGPGGSDRPRRRGLRRLAPAAALVLLLVIVLPLAIGGFYAYRFVEGKFFPADYSGPGTTPSVMVQVKSGDTASSLGPRLQELGVVASSRAFVLAAEHSTSAAGLEAGFYRLHHHMQASIAYQDLLNPANRVQLTITFPEGLRTSQVAVVLGERSGIPLSDYQHVLASPAQLGLPAYAGGKPEGYLFPATYQVQPNATALSVLQAMVQRFTQEAAVVNLPGAAAQVHLTPTQAIIVASLVQAEGGRLSDYGKIARVVYNRLAQHMRLQFDSTVFYGLGLFGTAATTKEISTPGPYNTYLNYGLPPGPIDNPGRAAIEAALHPAAGNWLYFISFKNGTSEFSPTPLPGQG